MMVRKVIYLDILNITTPFLTLLPRNENADPSEGSAFYACLRTLSQVLSYYLAAGAAGASVMPSSFFTSGAMSVSVASSK